MVQGRQEEHLEPGPEPERHERRPVLGHRRSRPVLRLGLPRRCDHRLELLPLRRCLGVAVVRR